MQNNLEKYIQEEVLKFLNKKYLLYSPYFLVVNDDLMTVYDFSLFLKEEFLKQIKNNKYTSYEDFLNFNVNNKEQKQEVKEYLNYLFSNFNQFYEIENIQNVLNYHIKDKIYKKFKVLDLKELFTITPNLYLFDKEDNIKKINKIEFNQSIYSLILDKLFAKHHFNILNNNEAITFHQFLIDLNEFIEEEEFITEKEIIDFETFILKDYLLTDFLTENTNILSLLQKLENGCYKKYFIEYKNTKK